MKYLTEGIIFLDCATCFILSQEGRRSNKGRNDVMMIYTVYGLKGSIQGSTICPIEAKRAKKNRYKSILHRFQNQQSYRNSHIFDGWTQDFCKYLNDWQVEDHSLMVTWCERALFEKSMGKEFPRTRRYYSSFKFNHVSTILKHWQNYVKLKGM